MLELLTRLPRRLADARLQHGAEVAVGEGGRDCEFEEGQFGKLRALMPLQNYSDLFGMVLVERLELLPSLLERKFDLVFEFVVL
jgi:hypothetical protein